MFRLLSNFVCWLTEYQSEMSREKKVISLYNINW
jgi:hypothetical protein